jgi:asparagine synthase (glutamine-hydrolysing)
MRGVLPEPIRTRREKRGFNDVYWRGLARNLTRLEGMARASGLCDLGLLDAAKLVEAMRQAALGVGDLNACERIDKTLALVAWFEKAQGPRPPAEPSEVHPLGAPPPRPAPRAATSC